MWAFYIIWPQFLDFSAIRRQCYQCKKDKNYYLTVISVFLNVSSTSDLLFNKTGSLLINWLDKDEIVNFSQRKMI